MMRLLILLSVLAISNIFLWIDNQTFIGFPFNETKVTVETYVYFLCEKIIVVLLAVVIFESIEYKKAAGVFLVITMVDTVDYILFYANPWVEGSPVSWNVVKVGVFGLSIIYEYSRRNG